MNKEEEDCAAIIDNLEEIKCWARNIERNTYSFSLSTSTDRFHTDFIVLLNDVRILVVEYKGEYLYQMTMLKRNNILPKL